MRIAEKKDFADNYLRLLYEEMEDLSQRFNPQREEPLTYSDMEDLFRQANPLEEEPVPPLERVDSSPTPPPTPPPTDSQDHVSDSDVEPLLIYDPLHRQYAIVYNPDIRQCPEQLAVQQQQPEVEMDLSPSPEPKVSSEMKRSREEEDDKEDDCSDSTAAQKKLRVD